MTATSRVHYFHADACAFGGYFERPIERTIVPQAPMSLSPAGGYGSARSENFRLEGLVSYKSASTQVSGHLSKKDGGGWVTLVTSVVEGLNVLDVVTADRLSAQISTEHPLVGDSPKVTFLGTSFENLKIAGCPWMSRLISTSATREMATTTQAPLAFATIDSSPELPSSTSA